MICFSSDSDFIKQTHLKSLPQNLKQENWKAPYIGVRRMIYLLYFLLYNEARFVLVKFKNVSKF